jgi:prefoldin subunit 5
MATASSLAPSALHARVQKLLGSRAELESTKALLHTLVARDAPGSPGSSAAAVPTRSLAALDMPRGQSLVDLRTNLLGLAETLEKIALLKGNVDALDAKCTAVQRFLESTKRETQQVQAEAAALATKK